MKIIAIANQKGGPLRTTTPRPDAVRATGCARTSWQSPHHWPPCGDRCIRPGGRDQPGVDSTSPGLAAR